MCIKDKKMTNTQVLQFIVEELSKYSLSWSGHKELFELICSPLSFENATYQQRKKAKEDILDLFKPHKTFNQIRFNKLADNIICGENEKKYAQELLDFLKEEISRLKISLDPDLTKLIEEIPCKNGQETNYKNNFSNWINGYTKRINRQEVKHKLEQNFYFSPSLWDQGEYTIKQTIREGVEKFVKRHTKEVDDITNMFEKIRKEFQMKKDITTQEEQSLDKIAHMTQQEIMKYIGTHYPLQKYHSQEFIQKMIPILYQKGYTSLLLHYVIEALELPLKGHKEIKKIMAHLYGSPEVGEYLKAFQILESIKSNDDKEIIDTRTEAISNIRRCYLSDKNIDKENKIEIIHTILKFYEEAFIFKENYEYYPAINLAYIVVLHFFFTEDVNESALIQKISSIHKKCESSIQKDKKQDDFTKNFYANITQLEFMLLKGFKSSVLELERYLEVEEECIPLPELARTHRQMQFFIDNLNTIPNTEQNTIVQNIQRAIEVIDDFIELRKDKIL
jgi:hypothetical protein